MRILARRPRIALLAAGSLVFAGVSIANPTGPQPGIAVALSQEVASDISVMTYNVKGLPWPLATGRKAALERIGKRLAWMREQGRQPDVIVLQEAFTPDAKAIGDLGGYRYKVIGAEPSATGSSARADRTWFRGDAPGPKADSGLVLLSDLPILAVSRAAFPDGACAGFDCLAAKGVLLVTLRLRDGGTVAVATTHLNSRGASRAPIAETTRAYREQVDFLARFLKSEWDPATPLVFAGDFNLGQRSERLAILPGGLASFTGHRPADGLQAALRAQRPFARSRDARWIVERARDLHYVFPGEGRTLEPVSAQIPFGSEIDSEPLSDHFGYTIGYRLKNKM